MDAITKRRWTIVGLLCLANIIAYVDRMNLSVAVAADDFKGFFGLDDAQRGYLNSAFFWTYAFLQVPAGYFTDRFGVKWPLAIGLIAWSAVSALTGFANTVTQLIALRLLLGIGEAVITPGSLRWIRFNVDEKQRGAATGLFFAGAKFGPAVASPLAAWLLLTYGWRGMFILLGLGSLVWLLPWLLLAKDDDRQIEARQQRQSTTAPVPFARVFSTPAIYGIIIGTFAYNYFNYFCLTWLPAYFRDQWKLSLSSMGWYTSFSFSGMAVVAVLAGAAADRLITRGADPIRVRKAFTVAGLLAASTEVIGVMSGNRDIALAFAIISLTGLGLATANYWALTQTLMPGAAIGRIAGVQNFASNLSGIVAPIVTGQLVSMTGSYEAPMQAVMVLLLLGVAAYIFLVRSEYAPKAAALQPQAAAGD
ncbi:MAG: MFS transporter [Acidobacteria bacterium]|nr:MFS transporter [Acidobacteriota bacterium]MBI3280138.1 MFS transporter [Acidobacteriota bacterium]